MQFKKVMFVFCLLGLSSVAQAEQEAVEAVQEAVQAVQEAVQVVQEAVDINQSETAKQIQEVTKSYSFADFKEFILNNKKALGLSAAAAAVIVATYYYYYSQNTVEQVEAV